MEINTTTSMGRIGTYGIPHKLQKPYGIGKKIL
jgi:hypothetical protein